MRGRKYKKKEEKDIVIHPAHCEPHRYTLYRAHSVDDDDDSVEEARRRGLR